MVFQSKVHTCTVPVQMGMHINGAILIELLFVKDSKVINFLDKEKIRGIYWKIDDSLSPLPLVPSDLPDDRFVKYEIGHNGIRIE